MPKTEDPQREQALPRMFTAKDRCDRCGAQAKSRALLGTRILTFCGHHGREYQPALKSAGAYMEFED